MTNEPQKKINPDQFYTITELNINKFIKEKKGGDALLLYLGYQQQSRYQGTNQSWSTDKFMKKKFGWGTARFQTAKSFLKQIGFIEIIPYKIKGILSQWFVKTNYMINLESTKYQDYQTQDTGKGETNSLSIKSKCLKEKKNIQSNKFDRLYNLYGLDKQYIDVSFKQKKDLDTIISICEYIQKISDMLCIEPIYNKDTINATHILYNKACLNDLNEFITKLQDNGYIYNIDTYSDLIRTDGYLPNNIDDL